MHRKGIILTALLGSLLSYSGLISQEVKKFSLKEAQQYAIENNYRIKNAKTDIEIARQRVKENTAIGFPQVSGSASYNDFLELPTQLIPGEFFGLPAGEFAEIQFGTQHNATWSVSVSQLLFSGQYLVGLQAAHAYQVLTQSVFQKNEIEIRDAVTKSYYPILVFKNMRNYFDSTLTSLRKSLYETEELYKNGFIEDTDVDQLKLLIADLETNLANMDNQLELGYNGLKFLLGMKASDQVELTESLEGLLSLIDSAFMTASKFDHNDHIDYRLLKKTEQLTYLQMKLGKSAYLPTLRAFYSYQNNAMRDEFDFFNFDKTWYPTQILGVQLDVPIWSSGMRKYKVNQSKLELDKIRVQDTELQQKLNLDLETGQNAFNNAYLIYLNRSKNKDLALKIHQKTEMKYKEGLSSSFDLSQSYNQYLSAEVNYLLAVLDLLIKKSDLDKLLTKASN
jgi:outer membrane protein TolC